MENEILTAYIKQIQSYPLLSAEQEKNLAKKIQNGDYKAKLQLINSNLRLVITVAKKYSKDSDLLMDIIQEGNLGLITAAGKFNESYGTRFSTYAFPWITQSILRFLQSKTSAINLPYRKKEQILQIKNYCNVLSQKLGRNPSIEEVALYMNIPAKKIQTLLEFDYTFCSIFSDGKENSFVYNANCMEVSSVEMDFMRHYEKLEMHNLIDSLPEKEKKVIYYRYSLSDTMKGKTLRQVAKIMGVSAECVRQIEAKAIKFLRTSALKHSI